MDNEEKASSNRQKFIDAKLMDEKFHHEIDDIKEDVDEKSDDTKDSIQASSHRQKILLAQILDEKVSVETEEDVLDSLLDEIKGNILDNLPEQSKTTISEMDETLAKLRQWHLKRSVEVNELYLNEELQKNYSGIDIKVEDADEEETPFIHTADTRTIASLEALLRTPTTKISKLADLSILENQHTQAASGYPSPEKLRQELRSLSFNNNPRNKTLGNALELARIEFEADTVANRRHDEVLESSAALEEEVGDLEARLRDFSGDLDLILHGLGSLTSAESRFISSSTNHSTVLDDSVGLSKDLGDQP